MAETNIYEMGYTLPDVTEKSDARAIQQAIDLAKREGLNRTRVPRFNQRKNVCFWQIDTPIFLPEHFVLEIDNAELIFEGEGAFVLSGTDGALCEYTKLCGTGNATLIKEEGAFGTPVLSLLYCKQCAVSGLILKSNTDGIVCTHTTQSRFYDLVFESLGEKASGIVLKDDCNNITVEQISGKTNGNTVELIASPYSTVRDILIKNIRTDCKEFANVVLSCSEDGFIRNVTVESVFDLSEVGAVVRPRAAVVVGSAVSGYEPPQMGRVRNLMVRNVVTRAVNAVELCNTVQDITISDISIRSDGGVAVGADATLYYNNIYLCNVKFDDKPEPYPIRLVKEPVYIETPRNLSENFYPYRAVCNMRDSYGYNFKINGIYANMTDNLLRMFGENDVDIYDVDIPNIVYDDFVGNIRLPE